MLLALAVAPDAVAVVLPALAVVLGVEVALRESLPAAVWLVASSPVAAEDRPAAAARRGRGDPAQALRRPVMLEITARHNYRKRLPPESPPIHTAGNWSDRRSPAHSSAGPVWVQTPALARAPALESTARRTDRKSERYQG